MLSPAGRVSRVASAKYSLESVKPMIVAASFSLLFEIRIALAPMRQPAGIGPRDEANGRKNPQPVYGPCFGARDDNQGDVGVTVAARDNWR